MLKRTYIPSLKAWVLRPKGGTISLFSAIIFLEFFDVICHLFTSGCLCLLNTISANMGMGLNGFLKYFIVIIRLMFLSNMADICFKANSKPGGKCNMELKALFESYRHGSHHGLTDLYPELAEALCSAIEAKIDFDTEWWSCRSEKVSGRISRSGRVFQVWVSAVDEFKIVGYATDTYEYDRFDADEIYEDLMTALNELWQKAVADQISQRPFELYTLYNPDGVQIGLYLMQIDLKFTDPPGTVYKQWGWQDLIEPVPESVKNDLVEILEDGEDFAEVDGWSLERQEA